jgi:hypothetical protein
MITAAITAAIAAILGLFGIKPGPYLVGVAIVVKLLIVAASVMFGARLMKWRKDKAAGQQAPPPAGPGPG